MDKEDVYAIAREAVQRLADVIGPNALFSLDQIWEYASTPVPSRQKSNVHGPLKKEGYIVATGGLMKTPTPSRAGSPATQYKFGPVLNPNSATGGGRLKWRVDASTFKLLGRGLITDRITAIYELVKNCYDANATTVDVEFSNVDKRGPRSTIIIRDNGFGMSLADIRDKWLVVGTASKRSSRLSPAPFNRRYIGEKGVGRFATDKLGGHLQIRTKRQKDNKTLAVTINWGAYEELTQSKQHTLFTELENEYGYVENNGAFEEGHGTELIITMLHESWDKDILLRLDNQLGRIIPKIFKIHPAFNIYLSALDFSIKRKLVAAEPIEDLATVHVSLKYDKKTRQQQVLSFNEEEQEFKKIRVAEEIFGPVEMDLYYFDGDAVKAFKAKYKNTENYIEGAKIYRDGVICTPFAEFESGLDTRRDVLGIDKRRYQEAFDKLSSRQFVAIIYITKDGNPDIIDATNRQDFVDTKAYRRLKEFIVQQIDELAKYRHEKNKENRARVQNNLIRASADVKDIGKSLSKLVRERPELEQVLAPTIEKAKQATEKVSEGAKESTESAQEFSRKEALYLSLMSLQDFANELAHGIRFALTPAKHAAEFFIDFYPNPVYEKQFLSYAHLIFGQTEKISTLVDFMLSYAQVDVQDSEFLVSELLEGILSSAYAIQFEREGIIIELAIKDNIQLTGKRKFIEDVLSNLISNSVKALKNTKDKKILCESYIDKDNLNILFSDNGVGVKNTIESTMFEMFKTTTAEEGGAGLGLFIARSRMNALNGSIKLVDSVFSPVGASFLLSLPLKK